MEARAQGLPPVITPALNAEQAASEARERGTLVYVPLYDITSVSGSRKFIAGDAAPSVMAFDRDWLRARVAVDPEHLALFTMYGDAMKPTLCDGNLLMVNRAEKMVSAGIYAFAIANHLFVQRLEHRHDGVYSLSETNPALVGYVPELREFNIPTGVIGRVIWSGGRL